MIRRGGFGPSARTPNSWGSGSLTGSLTGILWPSSRFLRGGPVRPRGADGRGQVDCTPFELRWSNDLPRDLAEFFMARVNVRTTRP